MMPLPRREFLGITAALPSLALYQWLDDMESTPFSASRSAGCVLLDAEGECTLRESLLGFTRGLAAAAIPFKRVLRGPIPPADFVVVAGTVLQRPGLAKTLRRLMDRGGTVLYESGAAYLEPTAFETEQHLLTLYFGLSVRRPLELWPGKPGPSGLPYVRYHWPSRLMIRDFSRIIPVSDCEAIEIAQLGRTVVACRRQIGQGTFIFLGSPLGPHLGCGDPEAQALLEAFLRIRVSDALWT